MYIIILLVFLINGGGMNILKWASIIFNYILLFYQKSL